MSPINLLTPLPVTTDDEAVTALLTRPGVRIERIVSRGHVTAPGADYDQPQDEWVLLLAAPRGSGWRIAARSRSRPAMRCSSRPMSAIA